MPLDELHETFDPAISQFLATRTDDEIRETLYSWISPLAEGFAALIPNVVLDKVREHDWDRMDTAAARAREQLDDAAAHAEAEGATAQDMERYESAGVVLEMLSYLTTDSTGGTDSADGTRSMDSNDILNFVYCLGVFETNDEILARMSRLAQKQ